MDFELEELEKRSLEMRISALEQMLCQILADQIAGNANGGGAAGMNVPVMPIIGGGGSGCVFQLEGNRVGAGACFVGRKFYTVLPTNLGDLSEFTGYIILRISIDREAYGIITPGVITANSVALPSDTSCDYPLYHLTNGSVDTDYRGAPHVQLRE